MSFVPCEGYGKRPVEVRFYPSRPDGLGATRAKTFGNCPACGYTVMEYGDARLTLKVKRHKSRK